MTQAPVQDDLLGIRALYASDPEREWQRMDRHRTEFAVTLKALREHLPPPPARILDCGGGPGRYAIALTQWGYDVTLFDLSPELLKVADQRSREVGVRLASYEQGTATDLSRFADASFDAVLLMGPLYHLLEEANRRQTLTEAYRVVKPGGTVLAAFISRYAGHIDAAAHYPSQAHETPEVYQRIAETGHLPPRTDGQVGFVAYFAHPREVAPLCRSTGLEVVTILGAEGITAGHETAVNALTGEAWDFWVDLNYEIARDPCIHGSTEHLLAICRKPRWRAMLSGLANVLNDHNIPYHLVGSASLALRGLPVEVHDMDLEMSIDAAYRFQDLFAAHATLPVGWRESQDIRSHFGRFDIDGVQVEVMAGLERRRAEPNQGWAPSFQSTHDSVELDGVPIPVLTLEEEMLATLRRGRLTHAALMLPHCDTTQLLALLARAQNEGYF